MRKTSYSPLTRAEKAAIRRLKTLEATWPDSLWLFSDGNGLNVMKTDDRGERVYREMSRDSAVDPDYLVLTLDIDAEGGDW